MVFDGVFLYQNLSRSRPLSESTKYRNISDLQNTISSITLNAFVVYFHERCKGC